MIRYVMCIPPSFEALKPAERGCVPPSPPSQVTDVDRVSRGAKKEAARRQAASGWYRNMHGSVSFRCVGLPRA